MVKAPLARSSALFATAEDAAVAMVSRKPGGGSSSRPVCPGSTCRDASAAVLRSGAHQQPRHHQSATLGIGRLWMGVGANSGACVPPAWLPQMPQQSRCYVSLWDKIQAVKANNAPDDLGSGEDQPPAAERSRNSRRKSEWRQRKRQRRLQQLQQNEEKGSPSLEATPQKASEWSATGERHPRAKRSRGAINKSQWRWRKRLQKQEQGEEELRPRRSVQTLQDDVIFTLSSIGLRPQRNVLLDSGHRLDALLEVDGHTVGVVMDMPARGLPPGSPDLEGMPLVLVPYKEWAKLGEDRAKKQQYLRSEIATLAFVLANTPSPPLSSSGEDHPWGL